MLTLVRTAGLALESAADSLRSDRELVLTAVKNNGSALRYVEEELKYDHEVADVHLCVDKYKSN